ncbi:hypothetical protein, partial [Roseinatronobacter sp.]|uniref:hypothetical protein n=1 Tax=Roseinatronobacter sp. TaxID=1945755 RepID=UPI003F6ED3D2
MATDMRRYGQSILPLWSTSASTNSSNPASFSDGFEGERQFFSQRDPGQGFCRSAPQKQKSGDFTSG